MMEKVQKKERMLRAARKLFTEQGFERTTMQKIADEANVGVATLFRYFPKKELLIVEVVNGVILEMAPIFEGIVATDDNGYTKMASILDAYIDYLCAANREAVTLLESFEYYVIYNPVAPEYLTTIRQAYAHIGQLVNEALQIGLRDGSIQLHSTQLMTFYTMFNLFGTAIKKHAATSFLTFELVPTPSKEQLVEVKWVILRYLRGDGKWMR